MAKRGMILSIASAIMLYTSGYVTGLINNMPSEKLMEVTAYCPCKRCCGKWADGMTASGYKIRQGDRFVSAPKQIVFGTRVLVPGYNDNKPVEVKDRGGAIRGNKLDVFFDSHQEALRWGRKHLKVKILKTGKE